MASSNNSIQAFLSTSDSALNKKLRGGPNFGPDFDPEECLKEFSITCWTWFENEILVNFEKNNKMDQNFIFERNYVILSSFKIFSGLKFGLRIQFV